MNDRLQLLNHGLAAGAVAALAQSLIIWLVSQLGTFLVLGVPLVFELSPPWLYQRVVWGGLWGMFFAAPVLRHWSQRRRGLVLSLLPALAALVFFLPFKDGQGMLGLELGAMMPVIVIVFNLLWGFLAGLWMEQSVPTDSRP